MALEASIEIEELGNGRWWSRASVRVLGRDPTARSKEFNANNYAALFSDITEYLDSTVPRPAEAALVKEGT
jgi:hypothetical protein